MTRQQLTQGIWSRPLISGVAVIAVALLVSAFSHGQKVSVGQSAQAQQPAVSTAPAAQPGPARQTVGPSAPTTRPGRELMRQRMLTSRPSLQEAARTRQLGQPGGAAAPTVESPAPAATPAPQLPAGVRRDAEQMRVPDRSELERQAAAARASALRRRQGLATQPASPNQNQPIQPIRPGETVETPATPAPGVSPAPTPGAAPVTPPPAPVAQPATPPVATPATPGGPIRPVPRPRPGAPATPAPVTPQPTPGTPAPAPAAPVPQPGADQPAISMDPNTGKITTNPRKFFDLKAEDRPYFINWGTQPPVTLEKACQDIEQMSGLSMLNLANIDPGSKQKPVVFQSNQLLTFDEMLTQVNEIFFRMNFWVVYRRNYLAIDQLTEWYRNIPPQRFYQTLEQYRQDDLPLWEVVSVMYDSKFRPATLLANRANDIVPINGARATLVPGTGRIELRGFVRYVEDQIKVILKEDIEALKDDHRVPRTYTLKFANAGDAARILQAIIPNPGDINVGPAPGPRPPRPPNVPGGAAPGVEQVGDTTANQIDIQEDQRRNALVVKASEENHQLVTQYLEEFIDIELTKENKAELIPLEHADPSEVVETIRPLLGERQMHAVPAPPPRPGTPVPPNQPPQIVQMTSTSTAIITPVPAIKSILVKASPDEMKFIKDYIKMLDVEGIDARVQLVELKYGQATSIANMLNTAFGQRPNRRLSPGEQTFHATADSQSERSIVISGDPKDLAEAKELIAKLDVDPDMGAISRLVLVEHASPTLLADMLNARYASGGRGGWRGGGGGAGLPRFIGDDMSRTLFVVCHQEAWAQIERDINEIDDRSQPVGVAKSYPLKHANASTIASMLSQSFGNRLQGRGASASNPTFFGDAQSNKVLVTASDEMHERIAALIADLDQRGPSDSAELKAIELNTADAAYVASKIEALFQQQGRGGFGGGAKVPVNVVAEPVSNRVLVSASPEDFEKAQDLARSIDEQSAAKEILRQTFPLQYVQSFKVVQALQSLFPESGGRFNRGEESPTAVKIVDTGDAVAVSAPRDKMPEIERVIREIDSSPTRDNEIKTYRLKTNDAEGTFGIAQTLDELFNGRNQAGAARAKIRFLGERGSDLLFVSAPSERMAEIDVRVHEMLESRQASDLTFAIRYFNVNRATPENVVSMVTPLLMAKFEELQGAGGPRRNVPEPQLTAQRLSRRVTVAAPESLMDLAEELIREFDQPGMASTMRIVRLKTASAADIAETIEDAAERESGGSRRSGGRSRWSRGGSTSDYTPSYSSGSSGSSTEEDLDVSPVEATNSLIIRGPEDLVARAEKLALEIDRDAVPDGRVIRVFELEEGVNQYDMISLIEDTVGGGGSSFFDDEEASGPSRRRGGSGSDETVIVKPETGNRLFVSAPLGKIAIIEQLIQTKTDLVLADRQSPDKVDDSKGTQIGMGSRGEVTMAYDVTGPVEPIAKNLQTILDTYIGFWDSPYVKPFPLARQIIVTGKPQHLKLTEEWIEKLQENPPPEPLGLIVKRVPSGMVPEIVGAVLGYKPPTLNVNAEPLSTAQSDAQDPMRMIKEVQYFDPITTQPAAAAPFVPPASALSSLRCAVAGLTIIAAATQPATAAAAATQPATPPAATQPAAPPAPAASTQPAAPPAPAAEQPANAAAQPARQAAALEAPAPAAQAAAPMPALTAPAAEPGLPAASESLTAEAVNPIAAAAAEAMTSNNVQIRYDEEQNVIYVVGRKSELQEMQKMIDDIVADAEKLVGESVDQPIRVFQVRYIDVTLAASILEAMFNDKVAAAPGAPGARGQQPPQAPQQPPAQQNNETRSGGRNARGNNRDDRDDRDDDDRSRRRRDREEDEEDDGRDSGRRRGSAGADRIRVMPDTRNQTLIVRAEKEDFPLIIELLLKIDRPTDRPPQDFRVFAIKKLNAFDVEQVLKSVLKIEDNTGRDFMRGGRFGGRGGLSGLPGSGLTSFGAQTALMEQLQQQVLDLQASALESATVTEGAEPGKYKINPAKEITITSDETTNTVIVLAPQEGMKLVEKLINTLEEQESPVQIQPIKIKNAEAEKVATQLEAVFAGSGRGGRSRGGGSRGGAGGFSGSGLFGGGGSGAASRIGQDLRVSADARTNTIVVRALASDMPEVERIVNLLDVPMVEQVQTYPIEHGSATEIAATLSKIFVTDATAIGPQSTRITADADTNTLLVWAPQAQQTIIKAKIDELVGRSAEKGKPREIQLTVASATSVAEKLRAIFSPPGAARSGLRQRISIEGDDNSATLFVTAPKEVFDEIAVVAKRLDTVTRQDIRVFKLKNALASEIHTMFTQMVAQQMQLLGKGGMENVPSVVPDARTNSLIVSGTPAVFLAVEKVLVDLDKPPDDTSQPTTAMFGLTKGNATSIAATVNALYAGRKPEGGVPPPTAVAEPTSNVVYVYGTRAQIDLVKTTVIEPQENYTPVIDTVVQDYQLEVKHAKVEEVADTLNRYFQKKAADLGSAGYLSLPPADRAVTIIPDPATRQLYITSSTKNRQLIETLLKSADVPGISDAARVNRVFPLQYANPNSTVQAITTTIGKTGNVSEIEKVNVVAELGTNSIVVSASPENMKKVEAMLVELDKPGTSQQVTRAIDIVNADANEVAQALTTIYAAKGTTAQGRPLATITVPPGSNKILVTCTDAEQANVITLVKTLDFPGAKLSPQIVKVNKASVSQLAQTLTRMFSDPTGRSANNPAPLILADESTSSLVVRATPVDYKLITDMAQKLDTDAMSSAMVDIIPVSRGVDLASFASQIQSTINTGAAQQAAQTGVRAPQVAIGIDQRGPALIVAGSPELFRTVRDVVTKLEGSRPPLDPQKTQTIVIPAGAGGLPGTDLKRILEQYVNQSRKMNGGSVQP